MQLPTMNLHVVRKSSPEMFKPFKVEYLDPMDKGRIVSQTFLEPPPTKVRKISCNVIDRFPKIAIKKERKDNDSFEVS